MFISFKDLIKEQARDLDYKISTAVAVVKEAFAVCRHRPALAFSAGKDSTVLWHLIRTHFPEQAKRLVVIYGNTGVEYPECVQFSQRIRQEWGNGNFYEATPGRTETDGLKYQRKITQTYPNLKSVIKTSMDVAKFQVKNIKASDFYQIALFCQVKMVNEEA